METPTKPERVEVGPPAKPAPAAGQRWQWCKVQFWTLTEIADGGWQARDRDGVEGWFSAGMLATDHAIYLGSAPAPATPGTATATPHTCKHGKVGYCTDCTKSASKPPAYGRLVGELRAPDGTPRSALEAIQAKREPEPWRPSVDEWDLLPDVDVRR